MTYQRQLEFDLTDSRKEQARRERCRRLLAAVPKTTTAAKLFDEAAQREAERLVRRARKSAGTS